jgi:uncharacterized protein YigE (DUF2233 family)
MLRQTVANTESSHFVRNVLKILVVVFLFLSSATTASPWKKLAQGIEYRDIGANVLTPWSHVHVFRIDLKQNQLDLISATEFGRKQASVDQFAHRSHALIAINAGFFDKNYHPLGLRIGHARQYSPVKPISWWGIFKINNNIPSISNVSHFKTNAGLDFAIQSGPRLLVNGKILPLKPGHAERTALGITKGGELIILVTDHAPMTTTALAKLLKSSPLYCKNALNLDGGSSSQMYARIGPFQLNAHGFSDVADAIVVKPKSV